MGARPVRRLIIMDNQFARIASATALTAGAAEAVAEDGFVVIEGPVQDASVCALVEAYDAAMAAPPSSDRREGSTTVRVSDFVNRGAAFDPIYLFTPLLAAAALVIGEPFRLS